MVGELNRLIVFDGFQLVTQGALVCLLFSHSGTLSIIPFPTPAVCLDASRWAGDPSLLV